LIKSLKLVKTHIVVYNWRLLSFSISYLSKILRIVWDRKQTLYSFVVGVHSVWLLIGRYAEAVPVSKLLCSKYNGR